MKRIINKPPVSAANLLKGSWNVIAQALFLFVLVIFGGLLELSTTNLNANEGQSAEASEAVDSKLNHNVNTNSDPEALLWAFKPLSFKKAPGTQGSQAGWIDAWVKDSLTKQGLKANPTADRATLIRRLYLDLLGLPPLPETMRRFVEDPRSDLVAWAALVDETLGDPGFGERWGRHWLDVARFAESVGRTRNYPLPHAWKYRDYVIQAFNEDRPFNEMIREQIAGDLMPSESSLIADRRQIATGFLALGSHDLNERNNRQFEMDVVDEQIDVVTRGFMGLTVSCARCHDHKFDPIPTQDYYAVAGIFRSSDLRIGYSNRQGGQNAFSDSLLVKLPGAAEPANSGDPALESSSMAPKVLKKRLKLEREIEEKTIRIQELQRLKTAFEKAADRPAKRRQVLMEIEAEGLTPKAANQALRQARKELQGLKIELEKFGSQGGGSGVDPAQTIASHSLGMQDDPRPVDCRIHLRGEIDQLGETAPRGVIQALNSGSGSRSLSFQAPASGSGRLEFANWIASDDNPLTARVFVNRVWSQLMGRGIVRTVDNFGTAGDRPTHPELLDALAVKFIENGWSVKSLIRQIVTSEAYRRTSSHQSAAYDIDPENVYYWRMAPRRLEAEVLRDSMLLISGRLQPPTQEPATVSLLDPKELNPKQIEKLIGFETRRERSVYLPVLRGYLPAIYEVFDFPDPSQVMGKREVTTVSTQALYMMNHPMVMELAEFAARNLLSQQRETTSTFHEEKIRQIYLSCLSREPSHEESKRLVDWIQSTPPNSGSNSGADTDFNFTYSQIFQTFFAGAEFRYVW